MKRTTLRNGLLLLTAFLLTTCNKIDWNDLFHKPSHKKECKLEAYNISLYPEVDSPFLFSKKFDPSGKRVTEITAAFFNLRPPWEIGHIHLRLDYRGNMVYMINMESPYDTSLVVKLNNAGRVEEATGNSDLGSYTFQYTNGRLSKINWGSSFYQVCRYDDNGNILGIYRTFPDGTRDGYFYSYDYSRTAKQQFYMDELRNLDNGFTLLQYLDYFPELNPVNLRISSRNGLETGSYVWQKFLTHHRIDADGKLLGYDIVPGGYAGGPPDYTATLQWQCQ